MKILDRYIAREVIGATIIVGLVIIAVMSFMLLAGQFGDVGEQGYTMWEVFLFTLLQTPLQFYPLFPIVVFLGVLIALSRLSSTSQLIVIRASGISIVRIAWTTMKAIMLVTVVVTIIGEGFAPHWQRVALKMQNEIRHPQSNAALLTSIWLHQNNTFTHIDTLENSNTMTGITRYHFDDADHMTQAMYAETGHLENARWQLQDLKQSIFTANQVDVTTEQSSNLPFVFQPKLQVSMGIAANEQTLMGLFHTIVYRHSIGLTASRDQFSFWKRLFQPIAALVMVCLAVPFVFGSLRDASIGLRITLGALLGFTFHIMNQLLGPITLVYQVPPLLAAILPIALFFGAAIFLLARVK